MAGASWLRRTAAAVTAVAVPAGGIALSWQWANAHKLFAMAAIGMFEMVVAVAGFAKGVVSDVAKALRVRMSNAAERALTRRLSGFDGRYRAWILGAPTALETRGVGTLSSVAPDIDEVYVDVTVVHQAPHTVPTGVVPGPRVEPPIRHSLLEFIDRSRPAVLAIVGGPGTGKTTLLRYTARQAARGRHRRRPVPILLSLRSHVAAIVTGTDSALPQLARSALGVRAGDEPDGWFEQHLRAGSCIVLLDGLDEVADTSDRKSVTAWVEAQVGLWPDNDFVVTSRPQGYLDAPITGADVLRVRRFTAEQVQAFVHAWYLATEQRAPTGDTNLARELADDLLHRLSESPDLYDLTANPLLLTMIVNVHMHRGALPGSRVDLYGEICEAMLWRRSHAKNLASLLPGDKKELVLRHLATAMMKARVAEITRSRLLAEIRPVLRRLAGAPAPADLLADFLSNGLLVEREAGSFSFAHHTFQEYLAAAHIRDKALVSLLTDAVGDPWWRETTLLYAARADADPIIEQAFRDGGITALALAFDCLAQGSTASPENREAMEQFLSRAMHPGAQQARRRLAVGLLLEAHLRTSVPGALGGRVCTKPVTVEVFTQFLRDTHAAQPTISVARGTETVVGIGADQAERFVSWANAVFEGERECRLPLAEDFENPDLRRRLGVDGEFEADSAGESPRALTFWIRPPRVSSYVRPELWVPAGADHPRRLLAQQMVELAAMDLQRDGLAEALLKLRSQVLDRALSPIDPHLAALPIPGFPEVLERQAAFLSVGVSGITDSTFAHHAPEPAADDDTNPDATLTAVHILALDHAAQLLPQPTPLDRSVIDDLKVVAETPLYRNNHELFALVCSVTALDDYVDKLDDPAAVTKLVQGLAKDIRAGRRSDDAPLAGQGSFRRPPRAPWHIQLVQDLKEIRRYLRSQRSAVSSLQNLPAQWIEISHKIAQRALFEFGHTMGTVVGGTTSASASSAADLQAAVCMELVRAAGLDTSDIYDVEPEHLLNQAAAATKAITTVSEQRGGTYDAWISEVCHRFLGAIREFESCGYAQSASGIRTAALFLAAETPPPIAHMLRHVAACTAFLETRHNGTNQPVEALVVAFD